MSISPTSHPEPAAAHGHAVANLRFHSNEMPRVFRLPDEILTMVAACLRPSVLNADVRNPGQYPIVALSQTCRRWRSITLDPTCAACWSIIPLKDVNWTQLCLTRSRNSPCSFYVAADNVGALATTGPSVQAHMSRVNTVQVALHDITHEFIIPDQLWELLAYPAPNISYLRIHLAPNLGRWIDIPSSILARQSPTRLTKLDLAFCDLRHAPRILHAPLRSLELNHCAFWTDINDMLESLRCMPMLQSLTVIDCWLGRFKNTIPRVETPLRSIAMSHLDTFHFEAIVFQAMTVFQYIAAPISVDIYLCQWVRGPEGSTHDELDRITNTLLAHLRPVIEVGIYPDHLELSCSQDMSLTCQDMSLTWHYKLPISFLEEHGARAVRTAADVDFTCEYSINLPVVEELVHHYLWPLATALFRGVPCLKVYTSLEASPRSVMDLFCFPHLRSLTARGATMEILLRELQGATLHTILPHLEFLEIIESSLSGLVFSQFLAALPFPFDGQLRRLVINECAVTSDAMGALTRYLHGCEIVWDNKTSTREASY